VIPDLLFVFGTLLSGYDHPMSKMLSEQAELLGGGFELSLGTRTNTVKYDSGEAYWQHMSQNYGPTRSLYGSLGERGEEVGARDNADWVVFGVDDDHAGVRVVLGLGAVDRGPKEASVVVVGDDDVDRDWALPSGRPRRAARRR